MSLNRFPSSSPLQQRVQQLPATENTGDVGSARCCNGLQPLRNISSEPVASGAFEADFAPEKDAIKELTGISSLSTGSEDEDGHPLDWYPEPSDDQQGVSVDVVDTWVAGDGVESLRSIAKRLESATWHPSVELAGSLVRAASTALAHANGHPAQAAEVRNGLLVAEHLFKKRGAQLIESNLLVAQRIRTEWELGRMLNGAAPHGGARRSSGGERHLTLSEIGVSTWQSKTFRKVASIDSDDLEEWIRTEVNDRELSTAGALQYWKQFIRPEKARQAREEAAARPAPAPERIPEAVRVEVADARSMPLDDGTVHLIVTSPPYAIDVDYEAGDIDPEQWPEFMYDWLLDAYRVTAEHGRLALNVPLDTTRGGFRPTYAQAVQAALDAGWTYRSTITWVDDHIDKSVARGSEDSAAAPHVIAPVEMVALFSKGDWKRETDVPSDLEHEEWLDWTMGWWQFPGETRAFEGHPAPFPIKLPHRLIRLLSFPGDTVLDPFAGSGTTLAAALGLDRQAIGFDLSEAYVRSTLRRVAR